MNINTVENIEKKYCTGCKMCGDLCPTGAIVYRLDDKGFWYPKVDKDKCVNCNKCVATCPSINDTEKYTMEEPIVYEAWSKDDKVRLSSTSGGIFWEIAREIIESQGIVVGCAYNEDWKSASHFLAKTLNDLELLKGSKYFQSDTETVFANTKKYLDKGIIVLFCGTPCQVSGLLAFLGKTYENLLCMDFICRSINSPMAFRKYVEELEVKYGAKVKKAHLKNKKTGWQSLASYFEFDNGKYYHKDRNEDLWVRGFIGNDLFTRESCFYCKYKKLPRLGSDITLGDFWGIKNENEEEMFKGISVVLCNSQKGCDILDKIGDRIVKKKKCIADVLPGNKALVDNPIPNFEKENVFFELLKTKSFGYSVRHSIANKYLKLLKIKIRKLIRYFSLIRKISLFQYVYYNYCCKNIVRKHGSKIVPYKGCVINIDKTAKLILDGRNLEIGINKLTNSKAETYIKMERNSLWNCKNGAQFFYNTTLELKENSRFESGFFSMNCGSTIIIDERMIFGDDVMMGRNVLIYDSDFHQILNKNGEAINKPKAVVIGNHVWLTSNITILKGTNIGENSIITAQTVIVRDTPAESIISGGNVGKVIGNNPRWNRDRCPRNDYEN